MTGFDPTKGVLWCWEVRVSWDGPVPFLSSEVGAQVPVADGAGDWARALEETLTGRNVPREYLTEVVVRLVRREP